MNTIGDGAVEVSCVITKDGPIPLTIGELPVPVRGLIQTIKSFEQTAIEAAVEGSREKAILALTINPLVANDKVAVAIVDEIRNARSS